MIVYNLHELRWEVAGRRQDSELQYVCNSTQDVSGTAL